MRRRNKLLASVVMLIFLLSNINVTALADATWSGDEWNNKPTTFKINVEPVHAYFIPFDTVDNALKYADTLEK